MELLHHIESQDAPTLVLLHGYGSNKEDLFSLKPYLPPVNLFCFQAPVSLPFGGFAWYSIDWTNGTKIIDPMEVDAMAGSVWTEIQRSVKEFELSGPLVIGGFSQGAILSLAMLKNQVEASGFLLMSGYALPEWSGETWESNVPIFQSHGTADAVIPFQWAQQGAQPLESNPNFSFKAYSMGHNLNSECIQDVFDFLKQF